MNPQLYPNAYYAYNTGSLLNVNIEGVKTVGFNQWDEEWEVGAYSATTGGKTSSNSCIRSKNYIPVSPSTEYYGHYGKSGDGIYALFYDVNKNYINLNNSAVNITNRTFTTPSNARFMTLRTFASGVATTTYDDNICVNISNPTRNGTYEPYETHNREIPVSTYFPTGMKSAGTTHDELTKDTAITRVGTRAYTSGDENDTTLTTDGSTWTNYPLTTPTTTTIDPPLNLAYQVESGGTESIIVDTTQPAPQSAAPTMAVVYALNSQGIVDKALSVIAAIENGKASTNYAIGSYLIHNGGLYRVTSAIATGETITPGSNVVATTVMAESVSRTS